MRSTSLTIVAAALLVLLGLLMFSVLDDGNVVSQNGSEVLGADSGAVALGAAGDSGRANSGDRANDAGDIRTPVVAAAEETIDSPSASEEVDLSLRGRVVSENGSPVSGARVFVDKTHGWLDYSLAAEDVASLRSWRKVQETVSGDDGLFSFADLETTVFVLEVHEPSSEPLRVEKIDYSSAEGLDLGDLRLQAGAVLRGRVLDARGQGVGAAQILESFGHPGEAGRAAIPGRGRLLGETDATGQFRVANIEAGSHHLIVDSEEHLPTEVSATAVKVGERAEEIFVQLESGFVLEGQVEGIPAERMSALRITARRKDSKDGENPVGNQKAILNRPRTVACDSSGKFQVSGLAAGQDYRLTAYEVSFDEEGEEDVERLPEIDPVYARPGDVGVVLGLKKESTLTLRVVHDKTGEPVTKFVISAGYDRSSNLKERGETKLEHPAGLVRFEGLRIAEDQKLAHVKIRAVGFERLEREDIPLKEGEELELGELRLVPAPRVIVQVNAADSGEPLENAVVHVGKPESRHVMGPFKFSKDSLEPVVAHNYSRMPTDAKGTAELEFIKDGPALVFVHAEGFAAFEFDEQNFSGIEDVVLTASLSRGGTVRVSLRDSLGRAVVGTTVAKLRFSAEMSANKWVQIDPSWKSDAEGAVEFTSMAAGDYGFRVLHESELMNQSWVNLRQDSEWTRVSIADGEEQSIELVAQGRSELKGRVLESVSPLAHANLKLIRVENGERVEGQQNLRYFGNSGNDSTQTRADEDGNYHFKSAAPGEYLVKIAHPTRYMTTEVPVTIQDAPSESDLRIGVASIEGRVTDPEGNPLSEIQVSANTESGAAGNEFGSFSLKLNEDEEGNMNFQSGSHPAGLTGSALDGARTDSDGRFVIRGVRAGEPINLTISDPLRSRAFLELDALSDNEVRRNVDFVLGAAGSLTFKLRKLPEGQSRLQFKATYKEEGDLLNSTRNGSAHRWNLNVEFQSMHVGRWEIEVLRKDRSVIHTFEAVVVAGQNIEIPVELQ